ncbi:MAG: LysR family transcriptional regulator [Rhodobacter sp.]|uniref:LysR family transcriptional regulator n=1 Tax=Pararhodobacter sp. TaxID=2127056 RepID=UPI001D7AE9B8|nr:LysR family transcriptional regulator [Pararhodobacter sp.]MCB1346882.1 LysR family transcriptional regulator [Paracoccaceae bacterium]MCC0074750.1 LysR family transcriptional regulator [Rhodobacter sp.]HPD93732.1 LysR family transcriptional regulator [Pararhodobacter sp.]
MPLTARETRAIRALADHRRLSAAAEALGVSPSALSRALSESEARLGATLFQRGWTGAEPTAQGDIVVGQCQRILTDIERVEREDLGARHPRLTAYVRWRHLRVLTAVVTCGSATAAARSLGMRQPAVSQALRDLAGFVPVPLFVRRSAGLDALPAALALAALWARIEAELRALPALLADAARGLSGRVAVGMMPFSAQPAVMAAFGTLTRAHPNLRLLGVPGNYTALTEALRRREIDLILGLLRQPAPVPGFVETRLGTERYTLIARRDHPIHAAPVTIETLARQRWVVAPHGTPLRRYFDTVFRRMGAVPPAQSYEIWSFSDAEQMIVDSDSLALLSYSRDRLDRLRPDLRAVAFDLPDAAVAMGATRLGDAPPSPAVAAFLAALADRLPQG